jgi:hypothetical protein
MAARFKQLSPAIIKPSRDPPLGVDTHQSELTGNRRPGLGCAVRRNRLGERLRPKGGVMRKVVLALLAAGGLALVGAAPAEAFGSRYPFCMQGDEYPGLSNCTFTSYEQCQASASGRFLSCIENPYFNPGGDPDPRFYRGRSRVRSVYPSY